MCAIVDANVIGELWDRGGTPAGMGFRKAVDDGRVPLVIGGTQLRRELTAATPGRPSRMRVWIRQLQIAGRLTRIPDAEVDTRAVELKSETSLISPLIQSDDHHIIALAQTSGARLLYSNDKPLTADFRNRWIIKSPRGSVYSTELTNDFNKKRRDLLARTDLCARSRISR